MEANKNTRIIIIVGCIITFIIVPIGAYLVFTNGQKTGDSSSNNSSTTLPKRSDSEMTNAIVRKEPELSYENKPIFTIVKVSQPEKGWYIVTLKRNDDPDGQNTAKMLLHDTGGKDGLSALLGPGTAFTPDTTQPLGIPDSVTQELNK